MTTEDFIEFHDLTGLEYMHLFNSARLRDLKAKCRLDIKIDLRQRLMRTFTQISTNLPVLRIPQSK